MKVRKSNLVQKKRAIEERNKLRKINKFDDINHYYDKWTLEIFQIAIFMHEQNLLEVKHLRLTTIIIQYTTDT